jgi:hypothetical protein
MKNSGVMLVVSTVALVANYLLANWSLQNRVFAIKKY